MIKHIATIYLSLLIITSNCYSEKIRLSGNINSNCNELSPIPSPDGRTLYFCRANCEGNLGTEDIWFSNLIDDSTWSSPQNIGTPLNNGHNNFVTSVSPDGNTIYVNSIYDSTSSITEGISISRRTENGWSEPEAVVIDNYYNANDQNGFYMSPFLDALLMTIQREDSFGQKDIYVSFPLENGNWSQPKNIGPIVNTRGDEMTPYLASDGRTLYFSTTGIDGYGNADVFITRRLDDTWLNWTVPQNLGPTINTADWDAHYKLDARGTEAYFVSNDGGNSDIYKTTVPKEFRPDNVALITGNVIDAKTKVPIEVTIEYTNLISGLKVGRAISEETTGSYGFTLPTRFEYTYEVANQDYQPFSESINLREVNKYTEYSRDILLIPKSDSLIFMPTIFFKTGLFQPSQEDLDVFEKITEFLNNNQEYYLELHGHADNVGSDKINMVLSKRRADFTKNILVKMGGPADRIFTKAFGEENPIMSNEEEEGRQLNRRVEFYMKVL